MGLNDTPSGERIHIGFFGKRNAGKSSVVNAVIGQDLAIVSDQKGTTTDPVYKTMELLPLGPVVIIDTPGFDDNGTLGALRIEKTKQVLNKTDIAVIVVDAVQGLSATDRQLIDLINEKNIPYLIVYNKMDLITHDTALQENEIYISALHNNGIFELKEYLGRLKPKAKDIHLVADFIKAGDIVILVIPIDKAAPKGRLILPEQQAIRDILDADANAIVVKENELSSMLNNLKIDPALIITDSQVFTLVDRLVPLRIPITSFSILMARYKGSLSEAVKGVHAIPNLLDGDIVLIAEGCTHHRQCNDIGTVKIPKWLSDFTGKKLIFETVSGTEFPEKLDKYSLILHCGACMLNEREVKYRVRCAVEQGIPITNYGIAIAYLKGIFRRSLSILPELIR